MSRACVIWWATAAEHIIKMTLLRRRRTRRRNNNKYGNKEPNHFIISLRSVRRGKLIRWKLFVEKTVRDASIRSSEKKILFWIINDNNPSPVCSSHCRRSVANTPRSSCELENRINKISIEVFQRKIARWRCWIINSSRLNRELDEVEARQFNLRDALKSKSDKAAESTFNGFC